MAAARVLICDDEAHILHVLSAKLRNNGFEVFSAADGEEGLELARRHHPDLIITDYQMPFLSGLELCARLRAEAALSSIPVIMLTARGFSLEAKDLADTNIRQVLTKPFSPREVLQTVRNLIGGGVPAAAAAE